MADEKAEQEESSGFVVRDKRRFNEEGEKRNEAEAEPKQDFVMKESSEPESTDERPGPDFSAFVLSLATQALVQLGEMPAPEGVQIPVNVAVAKQTIDILSMLAEKTRGNLSETEEKLMQEILHNLRMSYVKKKDA